ncbi:MAG: IS1096 element passenger TnpR family protein [Bacteroidia bacterium]
MSVYRFKIYFEDDENVWREIEIKSTQTFEDFHNIIQKSVNFDDAYSASFYVSNDTWRKGKEVRILRSRHALQKGTWMHETKIASLIEDPHQKFIYEFDPDNACWTIYIELLKILPDSPIAYPRISKSNGNAPAQYKLTVPTDVVEEDEETLLEEDDGYVHNVTEEFHENEVAEDENPMPLRTKTEAEELGEEGLVEEEGEESFEEEAGYEEEDI